MKKGKLTMIITIGLVCFTLVLVMSMQFKIVNEVDITSIETMRETELRTELASWKEKYDETNEKYEEVQNTINEYKEKKQSNEETEELLAKELEQVNMTLGKTDVQGEGISITLKSGTGIYTDSINADNLLLLINALKQAGAEAISINEQRIINMTDIVYINETFIQVNGQRILEPYVVRAIGNSTYLENSLLGNGGYVDELRKAGHEVEIQKDDNIIINKYDGEIKTKYID